MTDRILTWRRREREQLALRRLRFDRHSVCGCQRCGDQRRGMVLDHMIAASMERIAAYNELICDNQETPCTSSS